MLLPTECVPSCPTHPSAVYRLLSVRLPLLQLEPPLIPLGPLLEAKFEAVQGLQAVSAIIDLFVVTTCVLRDVGALASY